MAPRRDAAEDALAEAGIGMRTGSIGMLVGSLLILCWERFVPRQLIEDTTLSRVE